MHIVSAWIADFKTHAALEFARGVDAPLILVALGHLHLEVIHVYGSLSAPLGVWAIINAGVYDGDVAAVPVFGVGSEILFELANEGVESAFIGIDLLLLGVGLALHPEEAADDWFGPRFGLDEI